MPLFFFDVLTRSGLKPDETGLELASAYVAYITACNAIPELTLELIGMGGTPLGYTFEVADEAGRILWRIPFTEILDRNSRCDLDAPHR